VGTSYEATTVIGYKISIANTMIERTEPNCSHDIPDGAKHCPECGKKVGTRKVRHRKDQWDEFTDGFVNHLPDGFVCQHLYDYDGDEIWFGYGNTVYEEDPQCLEPKPYAEIKSEIKELLKPYTDTGLLEIDETEFGIWTIFTGS
jgi:hypothetical protein